MKISGQGNETYLFINGLVVGRDVRLSEQVHLLPASCSANPDLITTLLKKDIDIAVAILFLNGVTSQLHVVADTSEELAIRSWNSVWDVMLLSALFHCDAICNFQCDHRADSLDHSSTLSVTNYHLRGLSPKQPRGISEPEATWIEEHFGRARILLEKSPFQNAIHALASYNWHSLPRARCQIAAKMGHAFAAKLGHEVGDARLALLRFV